MSDSDSNPTPPPMPPPMPPPAPPPPVEPDASPLIETTPSKIGGMTCELPLFIGSLVVFIILTILWISTAVLLGKTDDGSDAEETATHLSIMNGVFWVMSFITVAVSSYAYYQVYKKNK